MLAIYIKLSVFQGCYISTGRIASQALFGATIPFYVYSTCLTKPATPTAKWYPYIKVSSNIFVWNNYLVTRKYRRDISFCQRKQLSCIRGTCTFTDMPFNDGSATTSDYEKSTVGNAAAQQPLQPPPPPNGGLTAWIQVLGAHFLLFNSWLVNLSFGVASLSFLIIAKIGVSWTPLESFRPIIRMIFWSRPTLLTSHGSEPFRPSCL